MSRLLAALAFHAASKPAAPFMHGAAGSLSFADTVAEVDALVSHLSGRCVGLLMDNGPAWAIADLATIQCGVTCVPLPPFFSSAQIEHSLQDAGVDLLLTDDPARGALFCGRGQGAMLEIARQPVYLFSLPGSLDRPAQSGIAKITYTSGTTGAPKGVCLSLAAMEQVAHSLAAVTEVNERDRSLSLLPLSTLLENIGSLYIQLLAGGECTFLPMHQLGLQGASGLDLPTLLSALRQQQPASIILVPQMLQAMVEAAERGAVLPDTLRFVAVGGAPVANKLLRRAEQLGMPVYEGYGLSEAASVVAVNRPAGRRVGSVGSVLPHLQLKIAEDGEILLKGNLFRGYLGDSPLNRSSWWPTGDLGYLDEAGFLHLTGRKKNIFITAFGRNVAPEWVERELLIQPAIAQAVLIGEARPFNTAIIVPRPKSSGAGLAKAIFQVNKGLPDYARISRYLIADEPFHIENGQLTGTGRPRRSVIAARYANAINQIYKESA